MTPEQKAKGIVEKYRKITYIDEYGNENYERLSLGAAKACAIEELKAIELALTDFGRDTDYLQSMDRTFAYYERLINEIEKL